MSALPQIQPGPGDAADSAREEQLREAHRMEAIGRLVSGVAHDFNNLLTGIVLCSDLLLMGLEADSRLRRYAEEIRSAGAQGAALIQQLMAVARKQAVGACLLSWNDIVASMGTLLTRLIGENIELVMELSRAPGSVRIDPAQAQQIILNLVLNARDAMPEGGRITLTTRTLPEQTLDAREPKAAPASWMEFSVTDTGCGMDAETRSRLFEPFFTTKSPGKGNGVGLATVHSIVTQWGGSIAVDSQVGEGTRIIIRLPQCEPRAQELSE